MIGSLTDAFANLARGPKLPSVGGDHALVTGTSSGIDWACVEALVKAGSEAVGMSRRGADAPHPEGMWMMALDMSSADGVAAIIAHGPYDVIVASAGESQSGAFEELPREALERLFQVNVLGQVGLLQRLLPGIRKAGRRRTVLVGSMLNGLPLLHRSSYVATKATIRGFRLSPRGEVARFGAGVTIVEPGTINTRVSSRRATYSDEGSVHAADVHRMLAKLNANEERGVPASEIVGMVVHEVATERPLALVARGSPASVMVPLMRRIPMRTMLSIMRRVYGLR